MLNSAEVIKSNMLKGISDHSWSVRIIISSIHLLLSLVNDILDSAKIDNGMYKLVPSTFLLSELLSEVNDIFETQALGKWNKFDILSDYGEANCDAQIMTDWKWLK